MAENTVIKDPQQIPKILNVIHDCWFNKDDIVYDSKSSILSIKFKREIIDKKQTLKRFWFLKKVRIPSVECFLKIHHAESYSVKDIAQVGSYDFNEIKYDLGQKTLTISTGVPIHIEIKVRQFEVSVEETEKVVGERTTISI